MTSKIKLYATDLAPNLNYIIEDIDAYLSTKSNTATTTVRYIEPKLQQTIVLKRAQSVLSTGLEYNYAKVTTETDSGATSTQYYFVQSLEWGSRKSVRVNLLLDTLNTLSSSYIEKYCDSKTTIIREHQNRWIKKDNGDIVAKVDPYDEGLSGSIAKEVQSAYMLLNTNKQYWVQISANATSPNVTDTHPYRSLIAFETKELWDAGGTASSQTYKVGGGNLIHNFLEGTLSYKIGSSIAEVLTIGQSTTTKDDLVGTLRLVKVGPTEVMKVYCTGDSFPYSVLKVEKATYNIQCEMSNVRRDYIEPFSSGAFENLTNLDRVPFLDYNNVLVGTYAAHYVNGIDDLDRTQSYLMQINTIPTFNTYQAKFIEGYNMLQLPSNTSEWKIVGESTDPSDYTLEILPLYQKTAPSLSDKDDYLNESKLQHHSITDSTINYQGNVLLAIDWSRASGNMVVNQWLSLDDTNTGVMKIRTTLTNYKTYSPYEMTAYVDNKYNVPLFTNQWTEYVRNGYNYDAAERSRQKTLQNWNIALSSISAAVGLGSTAMGIGKAISSGFAAARGAYHRSLNQSFLTSQRNLEEVQFGPSSEYYPHFDDLNTPVGNAYITKSPGNGLTLESSVYDELTGDIVQLFNPNKGHTSEAIRAMLKGAGKGAAAMAKSLSNDKLGTMVTTQALGSVNSVISAQSSIESSAAAYQYTISTKSQAKTAIAGNTTSYKLAIDNKITYEEWQPREEVLKNIAKTFYLTGYSHPVVEKPNITSRTYFNYLQCSPHWSYIALNNTNPLWLADMTERLNEGVTIFHHTNNTWDIAQEMANWETTLVKAK